MGFMGKEPVAAPRPMSISELNRQARDLLESRFPAVWVAGELSRVTQASSGHVYFGLKDASSRIEAVLWATAARRIRFPLTEGMEVVARGQLTVYPQQGRYQLVCQSLEPSGEGALRAAFLALKARLDAEGLTAPARKRPLPFLPRAIGIVTSASGAAIHDLTEVIWRRFSRMRVVLCPARVQGEGASREIAAALRCLNARDDIDVIIVGRGGGSMEDLWTFNDEALARAIAASHLPVISAVGHEIDVTIADLVADVRALTPSEAAERAVPLLDELIAGMGALRARLAHGVRRAARDERTRLATIGRHPALHSLPRRLAEERQGLDLLERRLRAALRQRLAALRSAVEIQGRAVLANSPLARLRERRASLKASAAGLERAMRGALHRARLRLDGPARALAALDPLAVLDRGFSLTTVERDGRREILRDAASARPGEKIVTTFARGPDLASTAEGAVERRNAEQKD